ncbi:MAG: exodeoxyribonuclease VII small subunit [Coriobacteriales bacterium]|jgi:exodeoxyribonuclease VII small subunit|nr:exodeoxyribonuclease VII small subunit [Coriobacteriales bacterium]
MDEQNIYGHLKEQLEEIVIQVRSKDVPLEKSLDLYDEALRIGGRCIERLEQGGFTSEEMATLDDHPDISLESAQKPPQE